MKNKAAFDIAYSGYKNEQENIRFVREIPIKQEVMKLAKWYKCVNHNNLRCVLLLLRLKKECKPPKKRKAKRECETITKTAMKKKKRDEKRQDF